MSTETAVVPTERGGSCIRCHVPVRPGEGVLVGSNLAHAKHYEDRGDSGSKGSDR